MNAWSIGGFALLTAGVAVHLIGDDRAEPIGGRTAVEILRDYDAVKSPSFMEGNDPEEAAEFARQNDAASKRRADLALELWRADPDHARVPGLLHSRWLLLCNALDLHAAVDEEVEHFLRTKLPKEIRTAALWGRAHARLSLPGLDFEARLRAIEDAAGADPMSDHVGFYAASIVSQHGVDMARSLDVLRWALQRPGTKEDHVDAKKRLARLELIGQPTLFELVDVRSGRRMGPEDLLGRSFVMHSWAIYEGELAEELLRKAKPLRAELSKRGVELVSVATTVDQRGRADLVESLDRAGVDWTVLVRMDEIPEPPAPDPWRRPRVVWYELVSEEGKLVATTGRPEIVLANL